MTYPAAGSVPIGTLTPLVPAVDAHAELQTSRQITRAGRYVLADSGDFASMPDLHQRVLLLICYGVVEPPLVGIDFAGQVSAQIRRALKPLTDTGDAVIKSITVSTVPGNSYRLVEFVDGQNVKLVPA